jgi:hypothetical protein
MNVAHVAGFPLSSETYILTKVESRKSLIPFPPPHPFSTPQPPPHTTTTTSTIATMSPCSQSKWKTPAAAPAKGRKPTHASPRLSPTTGLGTEQELRDANKLYRPQAPQCARAKCPALGDLEKCLSTARSFVCTRPAHLLAHGPLLFLPTALSSFKYSTLQL